MISRPTSNVNSHGELFVPSTDRSHCGRQRTDGDRQGKASGKRRAETGSLATPKAKRTCPYIQDPYELCVVCDTIDFPAYFTSTPPQPLKIGSLARLLLNPACPFCSYLRKQAWKIFGGLDYVAWEAIDLRIEQGSLSPADYLKSVDVDKVYRLLVTALIKVNSSRARERTTLCSLEICEGHVFGPQGNTVHKMVRRPIQPHFYHEQLRSWLSDDHKPEDSRPKKLQEQATRALRQLMDKRRLRVIDVCSGKVVVLRKLKRFCALSYVWGQSMAHYAKTHNSLECSLSVPAKTTARASGDIDLKKAPRTIQDAVHLVRKLGEAYLWVDSICIRQNNPRDKAAIVSRMDAIYSLAYLTIACVNGDNSNDGLRRLTNDDQYPETLLKLRIGQRTIALLPSAKGFEDTLRESVWSTRAWTFQEHALSQRIVFFTRGEVFFHGLRSYQREAYALESLEIPDRACRARPTGRRTSLQSALTSENLLKFNRFDLYRQAVRAYSSRSLSHDGDRLDAFWGILQSLHGQYGSERLLIASGLSILEAARMRSFCHSLFWKSIRRPGERIVRIQHDAIGYRALPSWSWTGWTGGVEVPAMDRRRPEYSPRTIDLNNLLCIPVASRDGRPWKSIPEPCTLTLSVCIVLHLSLRVVRCTLEKIQNYSNSVGPQDHVEKYRVVLSLPDGDCQFQIGTIELDCRDIDEWPTAVGLWNIEHEFLIFTRDDYPNGPPWRPWSGYHMMLVRKKGEFYERIGVCDDPASKNVLLMYPDQHGGNPRDYILSHPCKHVKLI